MTSMRPKSARVEGNVTISEMGPSTDLSEEESPSGTLKNEKDYDAKVSVVREVEVPPAYDVRAEDHFGAADVVTNAEELVTHVLHVDDDPTLSPWTFRVFFIGNNLNFKWLLL